MSKIKIKLNVSGIRELRHSAELEDYMTELGQGIANKCSGNYEVTAPFKGIYHSNVQVISTDAETFARNLKYNELLKALG